jgi:pyruvate kinase
VPDPKGFILTKIIATVGPACDTPALLTRLIDEGARVFRINFSHGTFEGFAKSLAAVREAGRLTGQHVGVLGDLSGPKIRVGKVRDGGIELAAGDAVEFQRQPIVAVPAAPDQPVHFSTTYPTMVDDVQVGERLFINDGDVRLLVVDKVGQVEEQRVVARVTVGGLVTSAKGINLPDNASLSVPSLTDYDRTCITWAVENEVDILALSFVRRAEDLRLLKSLLPVRAVNHASYIPVIAKIEKPQALDDLDNIVNEADGIMVARGDLGVEMDLAEVPGIQKRVISLSHDYGKPAIVATQMLQSMIESPSPTRAEVSDVANAIYDGADAVMLSGETAVGKYPVQTVHMMGRIARATERLQLERGELCRPPIKLQQSRYRTAALAHGVSAVVGDLDAKLVVTWSELGGGARYLSQNRLHVPIIAAGSNPEALRKMNLLFGVLPIWMERPADSTQFIHAIDALILERQWARPGDAVVVVKGEPIGTPGVTNQILIHYLGDVAKVQWHLKT